VDHEWIVSAGLEGGRDLVSRMQNRFEGGVTDEAFRPERPTLDQRPVRHVVTPDEKTIINRFDSRPYSRFLH
jgi:hypothetical protein